MAAKKLNLAIRQGETFQRVVRWEMPPYVYKAITAITKAAPVAITAVAHGLKTGWRACVVSAGGMTEINALNSPPRDNEFKQVTVTDVDNITINVVNSTEYTTYTSGGYLQFYTPVDMTGYTARMKIKDRIGGTMLASFVSPTDITIDNTNHTITLVITATATAAYVWKSGVYDLEMVAPTGVVTTLFTGTVAVTDEVTT